MDLDKGGNMKIVTYINAHKILVFPVVLGLMWFYENWSTEAFIYLSIHGFFLTRFMSRSLRALSG